MVMPPQVATRLSRCVSYEESRLIYLTVHYVPSVNRAAPIAVPMAIFQ
jgi:hypothetical protein